MSSVCYNPFIYCWLNENFRRKAKMLFTFIPFRTSGRQSRRGRRNSNSPVNEDSAVDNMVAMNTMNTDINGINNCDIETARVDTKIVAKIEVANNDNDNVSVQCQSG